MSLAASLRRRLKAARKREAGWVAWIEVGRRMLSPRGRSELATAWRHRGQVHQITSVTDPARDAHLFDLAQKIRPDAARILSFGCATGEEIEAIRARFPAAQIVGAEINRRSRRIAVERLADDPAATIVPPETVEGRFDLIFCLAVLQREPNKVDEMGLQNLSRFYPFAQFDRAIGDLAERLEPGGLLCIDHIHYRVEDAAAFAGLRPVPESPVTARFPFGPDGCRSEAVARTMFIKTGGA